MQQQGERTRLLRRNGFTFKQFFVAHDRCAMKIGTDSILLGAWAPVVEADRILDIGSGSGVIALMLAQRTGLGVAIDAVEIEPEASQQARENVAASPWSTRIRVMTQDITKFAVTPSHRYNLIVSNPPYFPMGKACRTPERDRARYTTSLSHDVLLHCAAAMLLPGGYFCVVLPYHVADDFIVGAQREGWRVRHKVNVSESPGRDPHRVLLALSKGEVETTVESLSIRDADGQYSSLFRALTQIFYLFM